MYVNKRGKLMGEVVGEWQISKTRRARNNTTRRMHHNVLKKMEGAELGVFSH